MDAAEEGAWLQAPKTVFIDMLNSPTLVCPMHVSHSGGSLAVTDPLNGVTEYRRAIPHLDAGRPLHEGLCQSSWVRTPEDQDFHVFR